MSLKISKNNVPAYNYLSEGGAMTNPAVCAVTIDKTGGTKTSAPVTLYLVASQAGNTNIGGYTSISITPSTAQSGIIWEVSLNNVDYAASINPADMDCSSADDLVTVYARVTVNNDEDTPLSTGNFAGEFAIAATENPPA